MTYREMLKRDHPEKCGDRFIGGCQGCPGDTYPGGPDEDEMGNKCIFNADPAASSEKVKVTCTACWNQKVKKDPSE